MLRFCQNSGQYFGYGNVPKLHFGQNRADVPADDTCVVGVLVRVEYVNLVRFVDGPVNRIQGKRLRWYRQ